MFYSLLDLRSSKYDVVSLYVVCFSVNKSVCFVGYVFDSVCELCLCFGCGGVGGVGGEWVVRLDQDWERWGGVMFV